jgi:chemotaxis protein CheC
VNADGNSGEPLLTELERDALTEVINIGVSRSAKNLSRMVKDQVHLSVPRTEIMNRDRAVGWLSKRENSSLVAVGQDFRGSFSGQALLIFPEKTSLELVRASSTAPCRWKKSSIWNRKLWPKSAMWC